MLFGSVKPLKISGSLSCHDCTVASDTSTQLFIFFIIIILSSFPFFQPAIGAFEIINSLHHWTVQSLSEDIQQFNNTRAYLDHIGHTELQMLQMK